MTIRQETPPHDVDNNLFREGLEARGGPVSVPSRGEVLVEDGALKGSLGRGRLLEQAKSSAWRPKAGENAWT